MKKIAPLIMGVVLSLALAACNIPVAQDQSAELTATMAALENIVASTQTALAGQVQPQVPTNTSQPQAPTNTTQPQVPSETPNPSETPTLTPTASVTPIVHSIQPAQPGELSYWIWDRDNSSTAGEKRVFGGDSYFTNQFERPFNQAEMNYRPDLDIVRADLTEDANFYYVLITVVGTHPGTGQLEGAYGVEIDLDNDGRGDYLVMADKPLTTAWDTLHVRAYTDSNNDVGGPSALSSDAPFTTGNGYDQLLFAVEIPADPDMAWARVAPANPNQVQIAFRRTLILGATQFLWGVLADDGLRAPEKMEYNDIFTLAQAGSPYKNQPDYPLKEVHSLDNTCRLAHGFSPSGSEPGLCKPPDPTATPTTTPIVLGTINVFVFKDNNNNGIHEAGEPPAPGERVILLQGLCTSLTTAAEISGHVTNADGRWSFSGIPAGPVCVYLDGVDLTTTPQYYPVTVEGGGTYSFNFGLYMLP